MILDSEKPATLLAACFWLYISVIRLLVDKHKSHATGSLKAVLFDIGDTLLPARAIAEHALGIAARQLFDIGFLGDVNRFLAAYREEDSRYQGPAVNHLFSGLDICATVAKVLSVRSPLLFAGALLATYRDAVRQSIRHAPTLVAQLSEIRKQGCLLGVVTDGTTVEQTETLLRLGVIHLIDAIVVSEDVGREKPAAEMFEKALVELGIEEPSQALMVGDSLARDMAGAKALGLRTLLLCSDSCCVESVAEHPEADFAITTLDSLGDILRRHGVAVRDAISTEE